MTCANQQAARMSLKLTARGNWTSHRLTGGASCREWLVTLPYYLPTYFSSHFTLRNLLLHVRCDIREGANKERVLFLQEVQSDWAQQSRRKSKDSDVECSIPRPPWLQEWPVLALKLMILHACELGCNALAWTTGKVQVDRYNWFGERGLRELYDHTLPKEANRILKSLGVSCGAIDIFLPVNFYIEPTETGYAVLDQDKKTVGVAETWEQAQQLLPNGAHEVLTEMHGVRLEKSTREAVQLHGFAAWGIGIRE